MAGNGADKSSGPETSVSEEIARNMIRLLDEGGKAVSAYVEPRTREEAATTSDTEFEQMSTVLGAVAEQWFTDPQKAMEAQSGLWAGYAALWSSTMRRALGEGGEPAIAPDPSDKRFRHEDWNKNPFFDFIKQAYLLTAKWADHLVEDAEGLDDHTRKKAEFYVKQLTNALSPSNFVLTNPEVLRQTIETKGENLVRGMHMLHEDIERGHGNLKIRQSDYDAFEVGGNIATTSGKVIYQNDLIQLIQYEATTEKVLKRPLLIVPPWINKFYILDLNPDKSFIKWCVDQGQTVFIISWVNPDESLAAKTFEDYMREGILEAADVVCKVTGEKHLNAIGYCVGGTLLATTLAYMAAIGDETIQSATFFTTQVDFTYAGDLMVFVDEDQIAAVEKEMGEKGYLEGRRMASAFNFLRSNDLVWPYIVNNYLKGQAPMPFDLLYWNSDSTRMPALNHSFYLREYYLNNALTGEKLEIGGEKVSLRSVKIPVYNLATKEDHIAPAKSAFYGSRYFGGDVTFVLAGSGHIAGVVNPPTKTKYQYWTGGPPTDDDIDQWLKKASETPGSWWQNWLDWIRERDSKTVKARKIGNSKFKPIEGAPGSYVKIRD